MTTTVSKSRSLGTSIRAALEHAFDVIEEHKCYHERGACLHFSIKLYNHRGGPPRLEEMIEAGFLSEERANVIVDDAIAWELESFVDTLDELDTSPFHINGKPHPVTVWFNRKQVSQCGRSGGYLQVPMPPMTAYYYENSVDHFTSWEGWEARLLLLKEVREIERFAYLVEWLRKGVEKSISLDGDDGIAGSYVDELWDEYQLWKEEHSPDQISEDDHY